MPKTQVRTSQIGDGEVGRDDLNTATVGQAVVRKIIQGIGVTISGTGADSGTGDVTINAAGGASVFTTVEVNLGAAPIARRSGRFTIPGSGMTIGKPVFIQQSAGPYTGKGSRYDEAEMDILMVTAKVRDASTIDVYWNSNSRVRGNYKFDYLVGA